MIIVEVLLVVLVVAGIYVAITNFKEIVLGPPKYFIKEVWDCIMAVTFLILLPLWLIILLINRRFNLELDKKYGQTKLYKRLKRFLGL